MKRNIKSILCTGLTGFLLLTGATGVSANQSGGIRTPQNENIPVTAVPTRVPQITLEAPLYEEIRNFQSDIMVNKDSSLDITETITVAATNDAIRHGITRDFPTTYNWKYGLVKKVGFKVLGVWRDGKEEPFRTESQGNGVRIYAGDKDLVVPVGIHTYKIMYQTDRQIGQFGENDQLYFNITGNGWDFPINKASAKITLPEGYSEEQLALFGYTGAQGSKEKNYTSSVSQVAGKTVVSFSTTHALAIHEGLTVSVNWPKGAITYPTDNDGVLRIIEDNMGALIFALMTFVLLAYYLYVWNKHGRDPRKGVVVPQFFPPENISPAGARYIYKGTIDNKSFVATIVNLGVKGYVSIKEIVETVLFFKKKKYTLKLEKGDTPEDEDDTVLVSNVFDGANSEVTLGGSYNESFAEAYKKFNTHITKKYQKGNFVDNTKYLGLAIGISFLTFLFVTIATYAYDLSALGGAVIALLFSSVFWIVGFFILAVSLKSGGQNALGGIIFSIIWFGVLTVITSTIAMSSPLLIGLTIVQIIIHGIFLFLMQAMTLQGSELRDKLEGFKMYLSTAEADDLKIMNSEVPDTFEIYQKYLPYAVAFDVETKWTKRFESVIAQAKLDNTYQSSYLYVGGLNSFTNASLASAFTSSISSNISSASTVPGSSSGGGGGGFSGGGGGGGGGGGW